MAAALQVGRYIVGERIAVGGMGEVRVATLGGPGGYQKTFALKLLLPHLADDPAAVGMFLQEARLASQMDHPNIVRIFDVGGEGGQYYLSMELVRGIAMSKLIRELAARGQQVSPPVLEHIARGLLDGLHYAHELRDPAGAALGIVHRDVTPHNVLLSVHGEVKLADFGIAKVSESTGFTRSGAIKGKTEYLAPEQIRSQPLDRRADVFAAGITLFHLATLRSPFRRDSDGATLQAVLTEALPPLADLRPDLSPAFVEAVERATRRDADQRFATARDLRDALALTGRTDDAESLGVLVRSLADPLITELDQKTRRVLVAPTQTEPITASSGVPPRRRWRVAVAVGGLVVLGGGATFLATRPQPGSAALPALAAGVAPPGATVALRTPVAPGTAVAQGALGAPGATAAAVAPGVTAAPGAPPVAPGSPPVAPGAPGAPLAATGPAAAAHESASPATPPPAAARAPPPRLKKKPVGSSTISVDAIPWAVVWLNGRKIGETPIAEFPISAGWVSLRLENQDLHKEVQRRVLVTEGRGQHVRVDLR